MKSILISIKPKWCNLIVNGEKTAEIHKSRPAITTPLKCYIYESMGRDFKGSGKIIGQFVCNRIDKVLCYLDGLLDVAVCKASCLTPREIIDYGQGKSIYRWYISDLAIYDEPKTLADFGLKRPLNRQKKHFLNKYP